ncbi:MAG TPA: hypothetical protein VMT27_04330, partial [Actinomycetes bacterium]|nr:hypothetical protein [Actinomycetes bacterium]
KGTLDARLISSTVGGVDDGLWHTATCWRNSTQVGVTVDGVSTAVSRDVGDIANGRPLRVGAKNLSSATDQFTGTVDYVGIAAGRGAVAASLADAPVVG